MQNPVQLLLLQLLLLALPASALAQFTYTANADHTVTIWGYTGADSDVVIPSSIEGLPVKTIGENAFYAGNFTSVIIPEGVSVIDDFAFYACTNLRSISIPQGVASIGVYAFCGCAALTNVSFSSGLGSIGNDAFAYCPGLTSVTVPNGVTDLGISAFADCYSLTNVSIPSSVTDIGEFAFLRCYNLTSIFFHGNALSYDGQYLFLLDDALTVYYRPDTTGWEATMDGRPTAPMFLPNPVIYSSGQNFGMQTNRFGFTILWATNTPVIVEACTNLSNPDWQPVQTNTLTTGSAYFSDPQWTNYPGRFYRLRSP